MPEALYAGQTGHRYPSNAHAPLSNKKEVLGFKTRFKRHPNSLSRSDSRPPREHEISTYSSRHCLSSSHSQGEHCPQTAPCTAHIGHHDSSFLPTVLRYEKIPSDEALTYCNTTAFPLHLTNSFTSFTVPAHTLVCHAHSGAL